MSITPIDMQTMIPKLHNVAERNQYEQNRPNIMQQQLGNELKKKDEIDKNIIQKAVEYEKSNNNSDDAKDKGKNAYTSSNKNQRKKNDRKNKTKSMEHKIDIRI